MNKKQKPSTIKLEAEDQKQKNSSKKSHSKSKFFKLAIFFLIFIITSLTVFSTQVLISDQNSSSWFSHLPIIKHIKNLAESADRKLKGEDRDRINILLLGMGGKNHDGGYLTDTIILASIELSTKKISLISIPRDLAVPIEDYGWHKINYVNALAEAEKPGSGGVAISQALSDILEIPVDYYIRIDFAGFINIVDDLGGLDVNVENTLDDYRYPVMGKEDAEDYESRYEHLHIDRGPTTMDGTLALKYARSRHALGKEGSDFARARRQQIILSSAKNKVLDVKNLLRPAMISKIINELKEHISTNLKIWEMIKLEDIVKDIDSDNISSNVIDNSPGGLLVDTISEQGAYLLMPKSGDFSEIQYFVHNIFSEAPVDVRTDVSGERATLEVRNGTWINGLAQKAALDLEKYGFYVVRIGNSSRQNFEKSVIYDLSYGEKKRSLTILKNRTKANVANGMPEWLIADIKKELEEENNPIQPDFILIIGQDADKTSSGLENKELENNENGTDKQ